MFAQRAGSRQFLCSYWADLRLLISKIRTRRKLRNTTTGSAPASMRDSDIGTRERPTHTSRTERPRMFRFREKPRPCQTRAVRPRRLPSWTHAPEWWWEPQRTRIPCGSRDSASVCLCTANSGQNPSIFWFGGTLTLSDGNCPGTLAKCGLQAVLSRKNVSDAHKVAHSPPYRGVPGQ
jgi:hypothetical protein